MRSEDNETQPSKAQPKKVILVPLDSSLGIFERVEVDGVEMMLQIVDLILGASTE